MITETEYLKAKKIVQEYESKHLNISAVSSSADRYTKKLDKSRGVIIYTIEEWNEAVNDEWITDDDGIGYWVKNGLKSNDDVFDTPQLDATHIVWYNK